MQTRAGPGGRGRVGPFATRPHACAGNRSRCGGCEVARATAGATHAPSATPTSARDILGLSRAAPTAHPAAAAKSPRSRPATCGCAGRCCRSPTSAGSSTSRAGLAALGVELDLDRRHGTRAERRGARGAPDRGVHGLPGDHGRARQDPELEALRRAARGAATTRSICGAAAEQTSSSSTSSASTSIRSSAPPARAAPATPR